MDCFVALLLAMTVELGVAEANIPLAICCHFRPALDEAA
ncbi:MAG: hypothetical protein ACI9P3_001641 [Bradyrhizobium sp.]|jgi:hypothetical protein